MLLNQLLTSSLVQLSMPNSCERSLKTVFSRAEITKRSYHGEEYKQVLGILARRLHSEPNHWRHVYKSLLLLEYMAKNGPKKIVPELKSNGKVFTRLQKFEYIDSQGKDQGLNVRNRCGQCAPCCCKQRVLHRPIDQQNFCNLFSCHLFPCALRLCRV